MPYPSRLLILDPGMTTTFGHNLAYNVSMCQACAERGLAVDLYVHQLVAAHLQGLEWARPLFAWSLYAEMAAVTSGGLQAFRASACRFQEDLSRVFHGQEPGRDSLVFCHSMTPAGLLGLLLWRANLPEVCRPRLAVNLMLGLDETPVTLERLALCSVEAKGSELRLFGGTSTAARLLEKTFGQDCAMLPSPLPAGLSRIEQEQAAHGPIAQGMVDAPVYGLIGDFRRGKNLHIIPGALLRYIKRGGRGSFFFSMPPIDSEVHQIFFMLSRLEQDFPGRLHLGMERLDDLAYYGRLASFSALLLPYSPQDYNAFRPSGPAIEAAVLGVPVISFAGGFIEEELAPLDNGSLFAPLPDATSLAEALLAFDKEAGERKQRAMAAAPAYAARHNAAQVLKAILD